MDIATRIDRRELDTDIAVRLLRSRRTPMHYKDLIIESLTQRGESPEISSMRMSQMLTQINLDARFLHMGKGLWGLRDWNPAAGKTLTADKPRPVRAKVAAALIDELEDDLLLEDDEEEETIIPDEDELLEEDDEFEELEVEEDIEDDEEELPEI